MVVFFLQFESKTCFEKYLFCTKLENGLLFSKNKFHFINFFHLKNNLPNAIKKKYQN